IKKGTCLTSLGYNISSFVEKPDKRNAEKYFMSGEYYWNSGMFLFKASCYLKELNKYRPDIYHFCKAAINEKEVDLNFIRINSDIFNSCPSESIDYAVMEKTEKAVVVPLQSEWSDVGSFPSLWEHSLKDANGNHLKGDVFVKNVFNSYIVTDKKIVAAVGVDNLIVVNTPDALLVVNKERCN
ncbi:sugar phosphate nucleotidyltransferase, partial [Citrobacter portucalensis]|uniref:sugar phosphate nucleotidyltransferase n=1 Tax=Citrobacter portucalensis TaxID=1639133 RepID=UPI00226B71B8